MKCFTVCALAAAMSLQLLAGCGQSPAAEDSNLPAPPVLHISDGEMQRDLSASGYSLEWKKGDGTMSGVVADGIYPLDKHILELEPWSVRIEDKVLLTFSTGIDSLSYVRYDAADIGAHDGEPAETGRLDRPYSIVLCGESVYVFHAAFSAGEADYYLRTESKGTGNPILDYQMSEEYSAWWAEQRKAVEASAAFKPELYEWYAKALPILLRNQGENVVCSPLNIYLALSMLTELTHNNSRRELLYALNAEELSQLRERCAALYAANEQDTPILRCLLANSLWLRNDVAYRDDALSDLRKYHHAEAFSGQMGSERFDRELREWTNAATKDLLRSYADTMHLEQETLLALVSTLYFKAAWAEPFITSETTDEVFHGAVSEVPCHMMHRSSPSEYCWGDHFCAVSLGFSEGGAMTFFLPDEGVDPAEILSDREAFSLLSAPHAFANSRYMIVNMSIPRFDVSSKTNLNQAMEELGIREVFQPNAADFSPLTAAEGIFLSNADHAATVSIDEEGLTGAAYTEMMLCGSAAPPNESVDFLLDRPFVFVVTARDSSILFAGIVNTVEH